MERKKSLKNVEGIAYRENDKVISNPQRPRIKNLDNVPLPAYDKVDCKKYDFFNIITSRGSPHFCKFCPIPRIWGSDVTFRNIDSVIDEIRMLYNKYGDKDFVISDDTFTTDEKRVFDFCKKIMFR